MVQTRNTREKDVIIRVSAVIKTWGDAVRRESISVLSRPERGHTTGVSRWYHGQSRVFRGLPLTSDTLHVVGRG